MATKYDIRYVNLYTDGTSAKKIAPVRQTPEVIFTKPKAQTQQVIYVDPVAILGIVAAIALLITIAVGLSTLHYERNLTATMQSYVEELQGENKELTDQFNADFDPVEVEHTALALGMKPQSQVPQTVLHIPAEPAPEAPAQNTTFLAYISAFLSDLFA